MLSERIDIVKPVGWPRSGKTLNDTAVTQHIKNIRAKLRAAGDVYKRQILHNGGNPDAATPRGGRRSSDCKLLLLRKIMTVLNKEVTANYVPAAAVKRRSQALSGITGCKGSAGGPASWK